MALAQNIRKDLFRSMLRVRLIEERIVALYGEQEMRCPTHFSIGQEAVAAGICAHLRLEDFAISAHRSHAHYLNKGGNLKSMMAELYGKADGCATGKGGSMHLIDLSVNFIGCVPIVGSTIPIGVGASFGATLQDKPALTAIFFGDGAIETGVFHESINYAAVHRLPVVFVCENNLYSVCTPLSARQPENRHIIDLARGHGVASYQCDGQEVEAVYALAKDPIEACRDGAGPVFFEFQTYRWLEHCGPQYDGHLGFRPDGEFEAWTARDPLLLHEQKLTAQGVMSTAEIEALRQEINAEVDEAVGYAKAAPFPTRDKMLTGIYA